MSCLEAELSTYLEAGSCKCGTRVSHVCRVIDSALRSLFPEASGFRHSWRRRTMDGILLGLGEGRSVCTGRGLEGLALLGTMHGLATESRNQGE